MAPYIYDEHGRRVAAPSKGERREKAILDEAEKQLREVGPDAMTVESIANAAGVTRAALYFYFRSKNDVLAALVQRATVELSSAVATADAVDGTSAGDALASALERTADLWSRHGGVMRAAVELSPTVPSIAELWDGARTAVERSATDIAVRGGAADARGPEGAAAIVRSLVGMTERAFYVASTSGEPLDEVTATQTLVWHRALGV